MPRDEGPKLVLATETHPYDETHPYKKTCPRRVTEASRVER